MRESTCVVSGSNESIRSFCPTTSLQVSPKQIVADGPQDSRHTLVFLKNHEISRMTWSSVAALGSFTLHFGLKYEIIYQLEAIECLFVFFQVDMFRAYTPIFRSNGCYNFFTYAARHQHTHSSGSTPNYTKDTICCICKEIVTSIAPEDGRVSPKHVELKEHK